MPGRNDACWCGSGKKYKKCHNAFDERLERLWEEGWEVLPRTLYKTPADIEGIKRSAAINVGVLDYVGEHIAAGMTTNQIDQMIYDYTVEHGGTPVVCHGAIPCDGGIPCDADVLHEGDIINVDCSTILDGYFSDSSRVLHRRGLGRAPAPGRRHPRQRGGGPCRRQAVAAAVRYGRGRAKDGRGRRL